MKEIIIKNQLRQLGDELKNIIKNRDNIFNTITIVIPNSKIEQWFKSYWLKTENDILMNVKFVSINEALLNIIDCEKPFKLISRESLKSLIIKYLSKKEYQDILPTDIRNYFCENGNNINPIKIYDFANKLSQLYLEYEQDQFIISGWQKQLYEIIVEEANSYNLSTVSYTFNNTKKIKVLNNKLYFFGFIEFTKLQETIINEYGIEADILMFLLTQDNEYKKEYSLSSAPSKLREIEVVHSKICELLKDPSNKYSDFLVLAPDISVYEKTISRVFKQDNINFPDIPYSINDKKRLQTNVYNGLKKLFDIVNKNYYTRLDFFNLINNHDIQESRGITNDDVINWSKSIIDMNVYRNNEVSDDWEYAKMRVLMSKVSGINDVDNNVVEVLDNEYIPYTNISFDDESIIKFVSLIDDLKQWKDIIQNIEFLNNENIILIRNELDKWFSIKDSNGFETNGYYKNVIEILNYWINIDISDNNVPLNVLFYTLLDASVITRFKVGDYFTRGITFSDFDINAVVSSKYIFFLNAGSKELPVQVTKSELDLREYDINQTEKIENSFLIQYQNSENKFYISYINKDLKTDEDFYPSSLIIKLSERCKVEEEVISLDETRLWNELYTKKEYKNKNYYLELLDTKEIVDDTNETYNNEIRKTVSLKDMADFLTEPLQYKTKKVFGRDDELEEEIKDEYEPFELDNMNRALLINKIGVDVLVNKKDIDSTDNFNDLKHRFNLHHKLPYINTELNEAAFNDVLVNSKKVVNLIKDKLGDDFETKILDDVLFNEPVEWKLSYNKEICFKVNGTSIKYSQIKKLPKEDREDDYLMLYVASLMHVSTLNENTYDIQIYRTKERNYSLTPTEAKNLLIDIYNLMIDYSDNVCLPINDFNKGKVKSLQDLITLVKDDMGPWGFFGEKKLFDYDTQLGYTKENFEEKYKLMQEQCKKLIKYMNLNTEESEE